MPFALPRKFHGDRRGNVAMMYALAVPVLMFGAGLAIDFTHAARCAPSSTPPPTRRCSPP